MAGLGFGRHAGPRRTGASGQRTAELQRDQLRRGISLEVRQAGLNVQDTADRFMVAVQAAGQAEEALRLARVRYESGIGGALGNRM
jgi:outer membrane protein TolC